MCKYCNKPVLKDENGQSYFRRKEFGTFSTEIMFIDKEGKKRFFIVVSDSNGKAYFSVEFCPWCGRKLSPQERWTITQDEKKFVLENYKKMKTKDIAEKIGKTQSYVRHLAFDNNVQKRERRPFTDKEIEFIKSNFGILSTKKIAYSLNRSVPVVYSKIRSMNLK